ncbi:hypothetical protein QBC34DRAFT_419117 [Podospora aff. communis PSN243]|uniref:DUF985 domain-containing protein n=1 Tax=Podospora aff. communis PSN243 TaxID=3040156 RepID=A0AAV9FW82_9PEZI|nr:hypothetical protein QBC34DRAFT_419117 [Podospora aff. communis PSN243]
MMDGLSLNSTFSKRLSKKTPGLVKSSYPVATRFEFPFGTTSSYHNWKPENGAVVVCILGQDSEWWCSDGSHKLESEGPVLGHGGLAFPEALLEHCPKREVNMKDGGVLIMYPGLRVREVKGRSFMYARRANTS